MAKVVKEVTETGGEPEVLRSDDGEELKKTKEILEVLQQELEVLRAKENAASKNTVVENVVNNTANTEKAKELSPEGYAITVIEGVKWVLKATFIDTPTGSKDLRKNPDLVRMLIAKKSRLVTKLQD
jgi:hypothetical protein